MQNFPVLPLRNRVTASTSGFLGCNCLNRHSRTCSALSNSFFPWQLEQNSNFTSTSIGGPLAIFRNGNSNWVVVRLECDTHWPILLRKLYIKRRRVDFLLRAIVCSTQQWAWLALCVIWLDHKNFPLPVFSSSLFEGLAKGERKDVDVETIIWKNNDATRCLNDIRMYTWGLYIQADTGTESSFLG